MSERDLADLKQKQALPLSVKISLTRERIRQWVHEFGEEGCYVSFSGGKDSTVLLDIVRNKCGYTDIPAVFVDVPTQYPELREFVKTFDNVEIIKPKISFIEVCKKYGFPLISKEVSEVVYGARKYLKKCLTKAETNGNVLTDGQTRPKYGYWYDRLTGQGEYSKFSESPNISIIRDNHFEDIRGGQRHYMQYEVVKILGLIPTPNSHKTVEGGDIITKEPQCYTTQETLTQQSILKHSGDMIQTENLYKLNCRTAMLMGVYEKDWGRKKQGTIPKQADGSRSRFNMERYQYFLDAPFEISDVCCKIMKKEPIHRYNHETGRHSMTAQMADESLLRTVQWLKNGCNAFNLKEPVSNPMSFWTEQDVLQYIVENDLKICSVYGDIVEDYEAEGQLDGQMNLSDFGMYERQKVLKCTGCKRTGCMLCGFGCHLEKESRFQLLAKTHPGMYKLLDVVSNSGVTMREAIEWINEHDGRFKIKL